MKSAAEIDKGFEQDKQFMANMGEEGGKKFSELIAAAIETSQHNLFVFSPSMSYVSDEWIKADPDFWKPKAHASAPKKKMEEKPAQSAENSTVQKAAKSGGLLVLARSWMWGGRPRPPFLTWALNCSRISFVRAKPQPRFRT
jgi:hypothetical protein